MEAGICGHRGAACGQTRAVCGRRSAVQRAESCVWVCTAMMQTLKCTAAEVACLLASLASYTCACLPPDPALYPCLSSSPAVRNGSCVWVRQRLGSAVWRQRQAAGYAGAPVSCWASFRCWAACLCACLLACLHARCSPHYNRKKLQCPCSQHSVAECSLSTLHACCLLPNVVSLRQHGACQPVCLCCSCWASYASAAGPAAYQGSCSMCSRRWAGTRCLPFKTWLLARLPALMAFIQPSCALCVVCAVR